LCYAITLFAGWQRSGKGRRPSRGAIRRQPPIEIGKDNDNE
jgi:hypothetical protein